MNKRTLLERLKGPSRSSQGWASEGVEVLVDSIMDHLRRMLNSRQGFSLTVSEYGIPDLTEIVGDFPEATAVMERAILRSIELYEPRLRHVSVRFTESDEALKLCFEITGQLVTMEGDEEYGVWFLTKINSDGKVEVSG